MTAQPCPICGNAAEFNSVAAHGGWHIACATCGAYEVTANAWPGMAAAAAYDRKAALAWAKAYNERHSNLLPWPCITSVCFGEIVDRRYRRM